MSSSDEIAAELRDALTEGVEPFLDVLWSYMADTVDVEHVPAEPSDGRSDRDALRAGFLGLAQTIPGFGMSGAISAGDDVIRFEMHMSGTLPDGTRIGADDPVEFTLERGRIVRSYSTPSGDLGPIFERLIKEASSA